MGGGLMQLVAYGAQDIYLTGNPQITFFKVVYRRHTNFSMEAIQQTMNGNQTTSGTSTVTVDGKQSNVTRSYSLQTITDYIKTLGGVGVQSITFSTPLTGGTITNTGTVSIPQADSTTDGYLSSADWNTFNNKLGGISGVQYSIPIWSTTSALGNSSLAEPGGGTTITVGKILTPLADATYDLGITGTLALT